MNLKELISDRIRESADVKRKILDSKDGDKADRKCEVKLEVYGYDEQES